MGCFHHMNSLLSQSCFKSFQRNSKVNSDKTVILVIVLLSRSSLTHQRMQRSAYGLFSSKPTSVFFWEFSATQINVNNYKPTMSTPLYRTLLKKAIFNTTERHLNKRRILREERKWTNIYSTKKEEKRDILVLHHFRPQDHSPRKTRPPASWTYISCSTHVDF